MKQKHPHARGEDILCVHSSHNDKETPPRTWGRHSNSITNEFISRNTPTHVGKTATYAQAEQYLPKLTVPMNRADPFNERDATGWQLINMANGNVDMHYTLYENTRRTVAFNTKTGQPEDMGYQAENNRISPQSHY